MIILEDFLFLTGVEKEMWSDPPPKKQKQSANHSIEYFPSLNPNVLSWSLALMCILWLSCSKKPKKAPRRQMNNRLKPLTLAYDGDADM